MRHLNKLITLIIISMAIFPVVAQAQVYVTWWEVTPFHYNVSGLIAAMKYSNSDVGDKILALIIRQDVTLLKISTQP